MFPIYVSLGYLCFSQGVVRSGHLMAQICASWLKLPAKYIDWSWGVCSVYPKTSSPELSLSEKSINLWLAKPCPCLSLDFLKTQVKTSNLQARCDRGNTVGNLAFQSLQTYRDSFDSCLIIFRTYNVWTKRVEIVFATGTSSNKTTSTNSWLSLNKVLFQTLLSTLLSQGEIPPLAPLKVKLLLSRWPTSGRFLRWSPTRDVFEPFAKKTCSNSVEMHMSEYVSLKFLSVSHGSDTHGSWFRSDTHAFPDLLMAQMWLGRALQTQCITRPRGVTSWRPRAKKEWDLKMV